MDAAEARRGRVRTGLGNGRKGRVDGGRPLGPGQTVDLAVRLAGRGPALTSDRVRIERVAGDGRETDKVGAEGGGGHGAARDHGSKRRAAVGGAGGRRRHSRPARTTSPADSISAFLEDGNDGNGQAACQREWGVCQCKARAGTRYKVFSQWRHTKGCCKTTNTTPVT